MGRNLMIELSDDDTIIGSIVENGEVTALLKVTNMGQLYFEAKKDSILPIFIENFGQFFENRKKTNRKQICDFALKLKIGVSKIAGSYKTV